MQSKMLNSQLFEYAFLGSTPLDGHQSIDSTIKPMWLSSCATALFMMQTCKTIVLMLFYRPCLQLYLIEPHLSENARPKNSAMLSNLHSVWYIRLFITIFVKNRKPQKLRFLRVLLDEHLMVCKLTSLDNNLKEFFHF